MKREEAFKILHSESIFPHCDTQVLHAPGECLYCDKMPARQALRIVWDIAFTGHKPVEGEMPCPSDKKRGLGQAHLWSGNAPTLERKWE